MSEFQHVDDNIVRRGSVWSSEDFEPSQEDYQSIFDLVFKQPDVSGFEASIGVAHRGCRIRMFQLKRHKGGVQANFDGQGPFFWGEDPPEYAPEWMLEFLAVAQRYECRHDEPWGCSDLTPFIFPLKHAKGRDEIRRDPDNTDQWTSDPRHPCWEEWEEHDVASQARSVTHTQMNRTSNHGWVDKVGWDAWELQLER
ncbi:MAG: hypothetical protein ABEN55_02555 [Bradymonadaceae bacterium]